MHVLYGDGIRDDYPAIQEMLDRGGEVVLPEPPGRYLISKTLVIPPGCRLTLPRRTVIRLADGANCPMIRNRWNTERGQTRHASGVDRGKLWDYSEQISVLAEDECRGFEIAGGVWDFNNMNQRPNPIQTDDYQGGYTGFGMQFFNVSRFKIASLTLKDPVNFAVNLDLASHFEVSDIEFDFNSGNPAPINMDGIHLNGNCRDGTIRDLRGACYDDTVALNSFEGVAGPVSRITVDGIRAERSHSAVRLLSVTDDVTDVTVRNIVGSFYQYCVAFTRYYQADCPRGVIRDVRIENLRVIKADRTGIYPLDDSFVFPLFYFQPGVRAKNITVDSLLREAGAVPADTFHIGEGAEVENLTLRRITDDAPAGENNAFLTNRGFLRGLTEKDVRVNGRKI